MYKRIALDEETLLTQKVIGAAIEVHRNLGPGLMESAYENCLCFELNQLGIQFRRQVEIPITYKNAVKLETAFRADMIIENCLILELKCVEKLLFLHEAQILTYMRLSKIRLGLLINFNIKLLIDGIKRKII